VHAAARGRRPGASCTWWGQRVGLADPSLGGLLAATQPIDKLFQNPIWGDRPGVLPVLAKMGTSSGQMLNSKRTAGGWAGYARDPSMPDNCPMPTFICVAAGGPLATTQPIEIFVRSLILGVQAASFLRKPSNRGWGAKPTTAIDGLPGAKRPPGPQK
jgi:hypothetical protein